MLIPIFGVPTEGQPCKYCYFPLQKWGNYHSMGLNMSAMLIQLLNDRVGIQTLVCLNSKSIFFLNSQLNFSDIKSFV